MPPLPTSSILPGIASKGNAKDIGGGKHNTQRPTHFICLPLVNDTSRKQLERSLGWFKEDLLPDGKGEKDIEKGKNARGLDSDSSGRIAGGDRRDSLDGSGLEVSERAGGGGRDSVGCDIPLKAIRPLGSLHLTLGVMSLLAPTDVQRALEALQELRLDEMLRRPNSKATAVAKPLTISLKSLRSMHPSQKTSILYAHPEDPSDRLLHFSQILLKKFKEVPKQNGESLLMSDNRSLLLHATIVNTIYVKGRGGDGGKRSHGKITFNAEKILERYREYEWMKDVRIEKVAICRMGAAKVLDGEGRETGDEEYVVEGEVDMP